MKYVSLVLIQELSLTGKSYLPSFPFSSNYFSLSLFLLTLFSFFFPFISLLSLLFLSFIRLSLPLCLNFRRHPLSFSYFCLFYLTSSHFSLRLSHLFLFSSLSSRLSFHPIVIEVRYYYYNSVQLSKSGAPSGNLYRFIALWNSGTLR